MMSKITFTRIQLSNGLRVIIHEDVTTPLVSCNVVYAVGSRDEQPDMTGMAHLIEHYMFCGSKHVADYDYHLQKVGAINNAYTSQDITHYYITLPASNIETALWLESDRMLALAFDPKQLHTQQQVVMEEFKENFLNRPYGDLWLVFNDFMYEKHPYKWLPIGKELSHIEKVTMGDVKNFFHHFYVPNNAVLVLSGNIYADKVIPLVKKWFGDIPSGASVTHTYPQEIWQDGQFKVVERNVPSDMLMIGRPMCSRLHPDYHAYDLLSDLLGSGQSSVLYQEFVTNRHLFTDITAYITETFDTGLFIIGGRPAEGVCLQEAYDAIVQYFESMNFTDIISQHLTKVKNRVATILLKSEIKIEDRSSGLAIAETLSCAEDFEREKERYEVISEEQLMQCAENLFKMRGKTLWYRKL